MPAAGRAHIVERAVAGMAWAGLVRNLGNEDQPFRHGLAAQRCDHCGIAVGDAAKPPRRPLGVIWSPNPWGWLHFRDDCTEFRHDWVDHPKAGATALLPMAAISRRQRSRGNSLRRA